MAIQPLSHVKARAQLRFDPPDIMMARPELGILVAECIAQWAQVECLLGVILAVILETEAQTGLAMFLALTSSNNQMTILSAAAKSKLIAREADLFEAVMTLVRSAAKERHRLAHWCWALSDDLPDALLLIDPAHEAPLFANKLGFHDALAEIDRSNIFVLRKRDAQEIVAKIKALKSFANQLLNVFSRQDQGERYEQCQTLSSEPQILEALDRLRKARKNNP